MPKGEEESTDSSESEETAPQPPSDYTEQDEKSIHSFFKEFYEGGMDDKAFKAAKTNSDLPVTLYRDEGLVIARNEDGLCMAVPATDDIAKLRLYFKIADAAGGEEPAKKIIKLEYPAIGRENENGQIKFEKGYFQIVDAEQQEKEEAAKRKREAKAYWRSPMTKVKVDGSDVSLKDLYNMIGEDEAINLVQRMINLMLRTYGQEETFKFRDLLNGRDPATLFYRGTEGLAQFFKMYGAVQTKRPFEEILEFAKGLDFTPSPSDEDEVDGISDEDKSMILKELKDRDKWTNQDWAQYEERLKSRVEKYRKRHFTPEEIADYDAENERLRQKDPEPVRTPRFLTGG